jgi:hypothetical protein
MNIIVFIIKNIFPFFAMRRKYIFINIPSSQSTHATLLKTDKNKIQVDNFHWILCNVDRQYMCMIPCSELTSAMFGA